MERYAFDAVITVLYKISIYTNVFIIHNAFSPNHTREWKRGNVQRSESKVMSRFGGGLRWLVNNFPRPAVTSFHSENKLCCERMWKVSLKIRKSLEAWRGWEWKMRTIKGWEKGFCHYVLHLNKIFLFCPVLKTFGGTLFTPHYSKSKTMHLTNCPAARFSSRRLFGDCP